MAQSYLIFDFGTNEEAAQQARHRLEGWKQAFRLGKKLELKFERKPAEKANGGEPAKKAEGDEASPDGNERIRLIIRLDFSEHERLSHHRWLERIAGEAPFNSAEKQVVRHSDEAFAATAELFDGLK